jgi:hypothetical protein
MKILPVGAEFFHEDRQADRQTNKTKLIAAFRNFWNVPKKVNVLFPYQRKSRGKLRNK